MYVPEFIERIKFRVLDEFNSERRIKKVASRTIVLAFFAAVVTTIAPTLADEQATSPEMIQEVVPAIALTGSDTQTVEIIAEPTLTPEPTRTPEAEIDRPEITLTTAPLLSEDTETSEILDLPPAPLEIQSRYLLKIPATAAVDPRATTYFFPSIYASTDGSAVDYTMVCIGGQGISFDIKNKRVSDDQADGDLLISGDFSSRLLVSGTTNQVLNLINSQFGLFAYSNGGSIAGMGVTFQFVAVSKPTVESQFCSAAQSGATTTMRALGLGLSIVKGAGRLK
jgi:hypothetical protein